MLEKEIKILEIDAQKVSQDIIDLWGEKTFEGYIHDVYYDFPDDAPKNKLEAKGRLFRLRKKGEEHIYTIKNKRKKIKKKEKIIAKDEHETQITDIESFAKVLEKYGMERTREKKKQRVSYKIGDIEFDIDTYDGIPPLLEIEGPDGETIQSWVKKLWLNKHNQLLWGSRKLFKYYDMPYEYFDDESEIREG